MLIQPDFARRVSIRSYLPYSAYKLQILSLLALDNKKITRLVTACTRLLNKGDRNKSVGYLSLCLNNSH